ncbi:MAG: TonB-dependent receptor [Chloracidobacterium sp.]|nr:TonB-dependent receptor [Chloracidobacterium sp.]
MKIRIDHRTVKILPPLVFFLISIAPIALGQTAQIVGTIYDISGARVPDAKVTVTEVSTGNTRVVRSNPDGYYTVPLLPPGNYTVTVSKDGFDTITHSGVVLAVGVNSTIDINLTVGKVSQEVSVSATAPLIDTQSGTINRVIDRQRIVDLPLNGRDITQLMTVQAGVIQTGSSAGVVGNAFVANGSRETGVNFTLDGATNVNSYQNYSGEFPNPDAVQEFSIQTNNFSAEYGNATGAVVSVVTKSGTNEFHGSAFEFLRNYNFNSRNFFAATTDSLKRNQFGGTFGGPLIKNKLFFFFSAQGTTSHSNAALSKQFLPTTAERVGDFSAISRAIIDPLTNAPFPGNQIPSSRLSPIAVAFLKYLPDPGSSDGSRYEGTPTINNQMEYTGKVDLVVGKHRVSGKYFYNNFSQPFTGNVQDYATMTGAGVAKSLQPYSHLSMDDVYMISPNLLNNFTFGIRADRQFNDWSSVKLPLDFQQAGVQNIAIPAPSSVYISISGGFTARPGWQYDLHETNLQWSDTLTWVHGRHEFKFGGSVIRTSNSIKNEFRQMGQFTFNGSISGNAMADFMLGAVYQFWQGGGEYKELRESQLGFFGQDNFRVTSNLTINLGLRWDPMLPPHDDLGRVECFEPGTQSTRFPNAPPGYLLAGDGGCPAGGFNSDLAVLSPRLGFAYRLGKRTVIRGGFGMFWNPLWTEQYNTDVDSAPFSDQVTLYGVNFSNPYAGVTNPFPQYYAPFVPPQDVAFPLPLGQFGVFSHGWRPSYQESFNLTVEREIMRNTVFRASYIGNQGRHLSYVVDVNYARYSPGATVANTQLRRPYASYGEVLNAPSDGTSSYNALQLAAERRVAKSISFELSYTWSKSIDIGSSDAEPGQGTPVIPTSLSANRGLSDFDHSQRFVASYVLALPTLKNRGSLIRHIIGGWESTGIVTLQNGSPFTVTSGGDNSRSGDGIDRADLIGNPHMDSNRSTDQRIKEYFNTAAFVPNAAGTFGTSPRNFIRGPGFANVDFGLIKEFPLKEKVTTQFRAEFFNLFNHPNFSNPVSNLNSSNFGSITSARSPRILQFALKLSF